MSLLETYVQAWRESADAIISLAAELDEADWDRPTDCPGWTVKDVVAHLAHLESELCHTEQNESFESGAGEVVSAYTEAGVADRRDRTPEEVTAELAAAVELRSSQLTELPDDPTALAPVTPAGVPWSWDTLLRNRVVDMWVHEQDIRRATRRPGGLDSTGAQVVVMTFSFAMPFVVGKRVKAPASSTIHWDVSGETPLQLAVRVGEDGRASAVETFDQPSTRLSMSTEAFTVLTAGRRSPGEVDVLIAGDQDLGLATLTAMAITP